jgi:hypothetical protein
MHEALQLEASFSGGGMATEGIAWAQDLGRDLTAFSNADEKPRETDSHGGNVAANGTAGASDLAARALTCQASPTP